MMTIPTRQAWLSTAKQRLCITLPLVPAISGMCLFIATLSPLAWNDKGFNPLVGVVAIGFGFVCAYSVAMFVETCFKKFGIH